MGLPPSRVTMRDDSVGGTTTNRCLLLPAPVLLPVGAGAQTRKRRRRKPRSCVESRVFGRNSCWRGPCAEEAWRCGPPDRDCLCARGGEGVGLCVKRPEGIPPLCNNCVSGQLCVETCEDPGELRCYEQCA